MDIFYEKDGKKYTAVDMLRIIIPERYFLPTTKLVVDMFDTYRVNTVLPILINKETKMNHINLPTTYNINVPPYVTEELKMPNGDVEKCRVLTYLKNIEVMDSNIIKDSDNCLTFLQMVMRGNIPNTLSYPEVITIWRENMLINSVHFGVQSDTLEMILSQSYRWKKDPSIPFAKVYGTSGVSPYDYIAVSARDICKYTATFTAMTYEDFDAMVTSSVNRDLKNLTDAVSPFEEVIKY